MRSFSYRIRLCVFLKTTVGIGDAEGSQTHTSLDLRSPSGGKYRIRLDVGEADAAVSRAKEAKRKVRQEGRRGSMTGMTGTGGGGGFRGAKPSMRNRMARGRSVKGIG